jgi:hypothetical protein
MEMTFQEVCLHLELWRRESEKVNANPHSGHYQRAKVQEFYDLFLAAREQMLR